MPNRVAISNLNASTIDILNVIRANASAEYQQYVPEVTRNEDIPRVGEALFGYPALANQFLSSLMNRIAQVRVKSATFNNAYAELKKGYLEYGETVEEVFVNIAKVREFSAEKAYQREFKRTIPDVRSAFHVMNWQVQYPITIQNNELRQAFLSINGVQDLIAKIVDSVYTASEYDEFLLFKYLLIKGIAHGKLYPVAVDTSNIKSVATAFRGMSNTLTFMSNKYNASGVTTATRKENQYIFMDSQFNAQFDVEVLASAFNMDKAEFIGKLKLIDNWNTFDNERFKEIQANSTALEDVTNEELAIMNNVKAVLIDEEWFQIYDNLIQMTETYVASGTYWNYFYNTWKTFSSSPFSNAVVFVDNSLSIEPPATITVEITDKNVSESATILTVTPNFETAGGYETNTTFIQTEEATKGGVAVHRYGAYIFPANANGVTLSAEINGVKYNSAEKLETTATVGATISLTKV